MREPNVWSSAWHCDQHGEVDPLGAVHSPSPDGLEGLQAHWLWAVLWPDTAGLLLLEKITLRDLRDPGQDLDLPYGAVSPHLPG